MTKRLLGAIPGALLATATIILAMHALVAQGKPAMTTPTPGFPIGFAPEIEDSDLRQTDEFERIDLPDPAPVPEQRRKLNRDPIGTGVPTRAPRPTIDKDAVLTTMPSDSPLVVVMRPRPEFPANMAARGLSGFVDVMFDVLPSGRVINVEVLESSHRGFERSAIRAAERFRFKAAVIDGVAQAATGIRYRFRFDMDN
ncbi:MAG: TonB family protein [Pseudomonadota bacterium]